MSLVPDTLKVLLLDASVALWRRPAQTARKHMIFVRVEVDVEHAFRARFAWTIAVCCPMSVGFVGALVRIRDTPTFTVIHH
mgnify:CR=1 FL=1